MKKLLSCFFGGSAPAKAQRRLKSWGLQVELAEELEKGVSLSQSLFASLCDLLDQEAHSMVTSDLVEGMFLAPFRSEEVDSSWSWLGPLHLVLPHKQG